MEPYLLITIIEAILYLILIPVSLKGHIREQGRKHFIVLLFGMVIWAVLKYFLRVSGDEAAGIVWSRTLIASGVFLSAYFFYFAVQYSGMACKKLLTPIVLGISVVCVLVTVFGSVVSGAEATQPGYLPDVTPLLLVMAAVAVINIGLALACVIRSIRKAVYSRERTRDIYLFTGILFLLAGSFFDFFPVFGMTLYPGSVIGSTIFFILALAAMLKYRLIEPQRIIRKGMTHLSIALILILIYAVIMLITDAVYGEHLPIWSHVIVLLLLVIVIRLIWEKVEDLIDRLFFRSRYAFFAELEQFVRDSHDISDYKLLGDSLVTLVARAFGSKCVILMMRSDTGDLETIAVSDEKYIPIRVNDEHPVIQWLGSGERILNTRDIETIPQLRVLEDDEKKEIENKEIELVVPMRASVTGISGLLILCRKENEGLYSESEMDVLTQITDRVTNELENARIYYYETMLRNELQRQDEERTGFLHSVAHELKTPLTSLLSSTELLEEDIDIITKDQRDRIINNIQRSAASMDRRVSELLDFARSQTGSLQLKLNPARLENMLREVVDREMPVIEDRDQTITLDLPESLPTVMADTDKLEQVAVNMISNASKYSATDTGIFVRAREDGTFVIVEVEDSAAVIEDDEKEKIFEAYYRGKAGSGDKQMAGLGLGLAISKQIIELHNGDIGVRTREGKGNVFYFTVPVFIDE